ncbi:autotransporter domain-containing protein [Crenalkalicoccus roseus]|uniref:autotransporter domain-containing protein n=1 Tax=Crenalkalicoccus roseus TaxID=1485588 RepID=UPI0010804D37|nr:autotransporter domain-containing protein [Crenalkalicoccus roseus]
MLLFFPGKPGRAPLPARAAPSRRSPAALLLAATFLSGLPGAAAAQDAWRTPEYRAQYGLDMINAAEAYARGYTGAGVTVGVIDTGLDTAHPEFRGAVRIGGDFGRIPPVIGIPALRDDEGHGTHVSGIIAARRDGIGMHGVAFNARLAVLSAFGDDDDDDGPDPILPSAADGTTLAHAISYLAGRGVRVINNSWGLEAEGPQARMIDQYTRALYEAQNPVLVAAYAEAVARDVLLVFAASNDYRMQVGPEPGIPVLFPEFARNWLAVTSTGPDGVRADYANACGIAAAWCLTAPGGGDDQENEGIYSAEAGGRGYVRLSGTSMAAPTVAGAVALVLEAFPWMSAYNLQQTILTTARPIGPTEIYGWGMLDAGRAVQGPARFIEGGFLADLRGHAATFSNDIDGPGGLTVTGRGALTLTGRNSYAGGTLVTGGATLRIAADSALGAPGGALTLSAGTLQALAALSLGRPFLVALAGGTVDTNGFEVALAGPVTLDGALAKRGAGELRLLGTVTGTGGLTLGGGQLRVDGGLHLPSLAVGPHGYLGGTGMIAAPTLLAGVLAPGGSPGTLTFAAPVTLLPTAQLVLELDGPGTGAGAGNFDRVLVIGAGNAFTAGGLLVPVLRGISPPATNSFTPALGQRFTVVEAEGGVQGSFAGLAQPAAGLPAGARLDALYAPTALTLAVTPASYADLGAAGLAQTPNQAAVGRGLEAFRPAAGVRPDAPTAAVFDPLYRLDPAALGGTLDSLSGTIYGDALLAGVEARRLFAGAVEEQIAAARGWRSPAGTEAASARVRGGSAWIRALGQPAQRVGHAAGAPGYSAGTSGVAVGGDVRLGPGWLAGAAMGYSAGRVTSRAGGHADAEALHLGAYGAWLGPRGLFAEAQLGGAWSSDTVRRELGAFARTARARAEGGAFGAGGRFGTVLEVGGWRLEPSAGLRLDRLSRDGATERGAGSLGLSVQGDTLTSLRGTLTARVEKPLALREGVSLTPSFRLGWAHDFAEVTTATEAAFLGAPAARFQVRSSRPGRDALLAGAGLTLGLRGGLALYASYAADLRENATSQAITGGLRLRW